MAHAVPLREVIRLRKQINGENYRPVEAVKVTVEFAGKLSHMQRGRVNLVSKDGTEAEVLAWLEGSSVAYVKRSEIIGLG